MSTQPEPENHAKPRRARWRATVINLILIVALVAGIRAWQQRDMVSGDAPLLRGITLGGDFYDLPGHLGRPLLVHFWATWCGIRSPRSAQIGRAHV